MRELGMDTVLGNPGSTELPDLDFVALAQGQGVPAVRVREPAELAAALSLSLRAEGPHLVEIVVA